MTEPENKENGERTPWEEFHDNFRRLLKTRVTMREDHDDSTFYTRERIPSRGGKRDVLFRLSRGQVTDGENTVNSFELKAIKIKPSSNTDNRISLEEFGAPTLFSDRNYKIQIMERIQGELHTLERVTLFINQNDSEQRLSIYPMPEGLNPAPRELINSLFYTLSDVMNGTIVTTREN